MTVLKELIGKLADGVPLTRKEAENAFSVIMSGEATPSQIGAFLMGLRVRGETVEEIAGAVSVMRAKMLKVEAPVEAMDIVGTGGDASGTYNVSTAAAFIVAGAGVPVAKHGNRAISSKSGAADALAALGVNLDLSPDAIATCIRQAGVGFMFAPAHHAAMRHVGPTRIEMGTRTIFNLLGPLANPAGVRRQLLGVFSPQWLLPLAEVLRELGSTDVWVVHGDGLDELTTTGTTRVAILKDGVIRETEITPEMAELPRASLSDLTGGEGQHNASALKAVLQGERSAYRDIAVLNAAAALMVAGQARSLPDAARLAERSIDTGAAHATLEKLVATSQDLAARETQET